LDFVSAAGVELSRPTGLTSFIAMILLIGRQEIYHTPEVPKHFLLEDLFGKVD